MTPPKITERNVECLLIEELHLDAEDIEQLRPGAWSSAFAFTSNEGRFVVRFSEYADDFARDAFATRFSSPHLPVPAVTHLGIANGAHYAVSERVEGGFLDDLDALDLEKTLPSLLASLNALRTAEVSASTGHGSWGADGNGMYSSWPEFLRLTLQDSPEFRGGSWRAKLESSPSGATAFDRDALVLERLLGDMPNLRNVIHSDLINYNAFVRDHRLSGVIDWGCALYGDFVYELAWFQFWAPWYPQWSTVNIADAAFHYYTGLGVDLVEFRERMICYQMHIGLTHQIYNASIGQWDDLAEVVRHTTALANEVR